MLSCVRSSGPDLRPKAWHPRLCLRRLGRGQAVLRACTALSRRILEVFAHRRGDLSRTPPLAPRPSFESSGCRLPRPPTKAPRAPCCPSRRGRSVGRRAVGARPASARPLPPGPASMVVVDSLPSRPRGTFPGRSSSLRRSLSSLLALFWKEVVPMCLERRLLRPCVSGATKGFPKSGPGRWSHPASPPQWEKLFGPVRPAATRWKPASLSRPDVACPRRG